MIREKYLLDLELYHNVYKGIVIKMEKQTKKNNGKWKYKRQIKSKEETSKARLIK